MAEIPEVSQVLTVAEVAAYLKVSKVTVRRWCISKKIPAFKIGREWRIERKALNRLMGQSNFTLDDPDDNETG